MHIEREVYCTSCRKRVAVYRRITSGEKLCRHCLYNSTVKQVRKTIYRYRMVVGVENAIYIIRPDNPYLSLEGFNIISSALKPLDIELEVLCINNYTNCSKVVKSLDHKNRGRVIAVEIKCEPPPLGFADLVKLSEAVAVKIAREMGIKLILTPIFRDELSILMVYGLLTTHKDVFSEAVPTKFLDDVKIARPFFNTLSLDIYFLAFTDNTIREVVEEEASVCSRFLDKDFWRKARHIFIKSPELMYSTLNISSFLSNTISSQRSRKCRYCFSYAESDVCSICSRYAPCIDSVSYEVL